MSDIFGQGWGSGHEWRRGYTPQVGAAPATQKSTRYKCADCGATFTHFYDLMPNIFSAMQQLGVPDECSAPDECRCDRPEPLTDATCAACGKPIHDEEGSLAGDA